MIAVPPPAKSNAMQSRVACQDSNVHLVKPPYSPGPAKSPYVLNHLCNFEMLQDVECPTPMRYSQVGDSFRYILMFWFGGAVNTAEKADK